MNEPEVPERFVQAARSGELDLPRPGHGATAARFEALWRLGHEDLSLARLGEAHADALAILAEAGRPAPPDQHGLAVWAAEGPGSHVDVIVGAGRVHLVGTKRWCSGAGLVSHALVTAHEAGRRLLVLVPMARPGVVVGDDGWVAPAFAVTGTQLVSFDVELTPDAIVGPDGFYLERPGFWYGAIGVAACWAGGAAGLVAAADSTWKRDAHGLAALGAARAACWAMRAALRTAATDIDSGRLEAEPEARQALALTARHVIEHLVAEVVRHVTRSTGPAPMAHDAGIARRLAELQLYVRQSHAERDLEVLGGLGGWCDGLPTG